MQWGNQQINQIAFMDLIDHLNRHVLFQYHWGLASRIDHAEKVFARLIEEEPQRHLVQPRVVYGIYACVVEHEDLLVYSNFDDPEPLIQFYFPRQQQGEHLCVTDFFQPLNPQEPRGLIAFQAVTIGQQSSDYEQQLFAQDRYQEYLYRYGFHAALTEALAECVTNQIAQTPDLKQFKGMRYSFGYNCCPDINQQKLLLNLLGADQIGIDETESNQLIPLHSTAAFVCFNPNARYFHINALNPKS